MQTYKHTSERGFTLIELMVSLSLFAIVMTICAGSVLVVIDANQKAQSSSAIMTNLQVALDGMSREIRTGTAYDASVSNAFSFTTQDGVATTYSLSTNGTTGLNSIIKTVSSVSQPITADEVNVTKLTFTTQGTLSTDALQPSVLIIMSGEVGTKEKLKTTFNIQTTVSQRFLDKP